MESDTRTILLSCYSYWVTIFPDIYCKCELLSLFGMFWRFLTGYFPVLNRTLISGIHFANQKPKLQILVSCNSWKFCETDNNTYLSDLVEGILREGEQEIKDQGEQEEQGAGEQGEYKQSKGGKESKESKESSSENKDVTFSSSQPNVQRWSSIVSTHNDQS